MDGYDFRRNSPYMSPHTYSCLPPIGRCLSASGSPYQKMQRGLPTRSPSWPYLQGRGALGPGEASPPFHAPLESYRPYTAPAPLLTPPPPPLPPPMPTAPELPLRRLFDSQLNLRYGSLHGIHGSRLVGAHSLMGDCYDSSLEYDLFEGESFPSPFDVPYRPPTRGPFEPPDEDPYVTTMCPSSHSTFDCPSRSFDVLPREPSVRKPAWANCFPSSWRCESQADWPWYPRAEWTNYPPITTQDIRIRPGQSHLKRYSESGPTTTRPGVARCYSGCQMRQVPEIWSRDTLATEAPAKKPRKQWNALRPPLENPQLKSPNQLVTPDHMIDRRSSFWPPGELFVHLKQLNTQRSQLGSLDRIQEVPGDRLDEDPQDRVQGSTQSESPGSWFPSDESMGGLSDRQRIHPKSLQDRLLDIAESEISLDPKDARENSSTEDVQRKTRCELSQEPQKKSSDRSTDVSHGEPPNTAQGETHYGPENQSPSEVGGGSRSEPRLGGPKSIREDAPLEKPAARSLSYIVQPSGGGFCGASPPSERRGPQGSRIVRGARMQHRFLPNWLFLALERAPEVLHAAVDFYFEHMRWPELADQPAHFRESIPASARPRDLRATAGGFAPAWVFALRRLAEGGVVAGALLAQALAHFFARGAFPPLAFYPPALRTACAHLRLQDDHFYALDL